MLIKNQERRKKEERIKERKKKKTKKKREKVFFKKSRISVFLINSRKTGSTIHNAQIRDFIQQGIHKETKSSFVSLKKNLVYDVPSVG